MSKFVAVCDCPEDRNYTAYVAGKFREVQVTDGNCVHCGHYAMLMKRETLQRKTKKKDEPSLQEDHSLSEEWVNGAIVSDLEIIDIE